MPRFEDRFQTLCFRDGLVWAVEITVEIRLRFQIPPVFCTAGGDSETASTHMSVGKQTYCSGFRRTNLTISAEKSYRQYTFKVKFMKTKLTLSC